jgi:predicted ATPase/transcriptional regulator with XRE-family HTH domain
MTTSGAKVTSVSSVEEDLPLHFSEWLKCRRRQLDLTQEQLAQRASCSVFAIRKIESGERQPSRQLARILAQSLDIPADNHPTFIQVARGERNVECLRTIIPRRASLPAGEPRPTTGNLPQVLTPFIGREPELSALGGLLCDPQCLLLTIVGPGGIGKTRLAIEAGNQYQERFPDGVWFVSLVALNSPTLIVPAIADALHFRFQDLANPQAQILQYLHQKRALLVLDNAEHLLDGVGVFTEILKHCPQVKLLVTSRERLNLLSEWVFEVQGLPVPPNEQVEHFESYSSVALFLQSAGRAFPGFAFNEVDLAGVVHICRLVEGMPLAIELAATWLRLLSPAEIAKEIGGSLDALSTSVRDLPERHRSMRAVFEHSWCLLTQQEQQALSRLSVFRGGFTREAAEQVAEIGLDTLCALAAKSLIQRSEEKRFSMHELVRQYATRQLEAADENEESQQRHITFFTDFAEDCKQHFSGPLMAACLERMEQDNDNLRAALDYSITLKVGHMALRLSAALWRFWEYRGYVEEGRRWLNAVLDLPDIRTEEYDCQLAKVLQAAGALARIQGDFAQASCLYEDSLVLRRKAGDEKGIAAALNGLGLLSMYEGEYDQAAIYLHESLQFCRKFDSKVEIVRRLNNLGIVAMYQGDYEKASTLFEECLGIYQELNDRHGVAGSLGNLGDVLRYQSQYDRAMEVLEESLALLHEIGDVHGLVVTLASIARVHLAKGNVDQALATFHTSLMQNQRVGDKTEMANSLEGIAETLGAPARHSREAEDEIRLAVRLLAAAGQLRARVGAPRSAAECAEYDRITAQLRSQLSESDFLMEWKRGTEMTTEQAVEIALYHLSQNSTAIDVG